MPTRRGAQVAARVMTIALLGTAIVVVAYLLFVRGGEPYSLTLSLQNASQLVKGNEVYFADINPRPYDSGLVTLRSQRLSQFELHARAILGFAVDTIMISPAAAEVSYAGAESTGAKDADLRVVAEALAVAESDVRLFGRPDETDGRRRLGLALATAPDPIVARDRARRVSAVLRKLW